MSDHQDLNKQNLSRKFENLPDIDRYAPEVFESEDVTHAEGTLISDPNFESLSDELVNSEAIIKTHISKKASSKKFQDAILNSLDSDFTDSLNKHRLRAYRSAIGKTRHFHPTDIPTENDSSIEIHTGYVNKSIQETPFQKIRRLVYEVTELETELQERSRGTDETKAKEADDSELNENLSKELLNYASELRKELEKKEQEVTSLKQDDLNVGEKLIKKLLDMKFENESSQVHSNESTNAALSKENYQDFSTRISKLENLVGSSDIGYSTDILSSLDDLEKHVNLLSNPGHLEILNKKCQLASIEIDRYIQKKRELDVISESSPLISRETIEKINSLYTFVENSQNYIDSLPIIIDRLHALKDSHSITSNVARTVDSLNEERSTMESTLTNCEKILDNLEKSFEENRKTMNENLKWISENLRKG